MTEIILLVQDSLEGGFKARALSASIYIEANTLDELKELIRDAVSCHINENERPKLIRLHYAHEEIIAA